VTEREMIAVFYDLTSHLAAKISETFTVCLATKSAGTAADIHCKNSTTL